MKRISLLGAWILAMILLTGGMPAAAQHPGPNTISYTVLLGPVYPIEGESRQITGQVQLDDSTGQLQHLEFTVPLQSFYGTNSGYLAWLGNGWYFPDLEFWSRHIDEQNDALRIKGTARFRGYSTPVTLNATRRDTLDTFVLSGTFSLPVYDFFPFSPPPFALVPSAIPMAFHLSFDKPNTKAGAAGPS